MPKVKIRSKHQITIPKRIFEEMDFEVGDMIEMISQNGKIIIIPKLCKQEQEMLELAKEKIKAINEDISTSSGLTIAEADIAARVGLIDPEQKWWWTEEWQKGERETEKDIINGNVSACFERSEDLINHLKTQHV